MTVPACPGDTPFAVRSAIASLTRLPFGDLPDDLRLGHEGLGLDSIAVVELLLSCETQFGVTLAAELLDGTPLTVGSLIAHIAAARAGR